MAGLKQPGKRSLPALRPVELLVLVELAQQDQHGYGIVQAVEEHSVGAVSLRPGNLYRVLHRLIDRGLIEESSKRPAASSDDERRRYYRITQAGRREAALELERVEAFAELARGRLGSTR